jgi:hypothetical protein
MSGHPSERGGRLEGRVPLLTSAVAVVLAVAAVVVAVVALVSGGRDDGAPSYSDAQRSVDTRTVCDAFALNLRGVSLQTGAKAPEGASGESAAAANARLALFAASVNLTDTLDSAPAVPDDLRTAVRELATQYRTVATQYLAGAANDAPEVTAAIRSAGAAATEIENACKR